MGVFAVGERVIEGDRDSLTVNQQFHSVCRHGCHGRSLWFVDTAEVLGIAKHRFTVVIVHVPADAIADGGSEGISSHGIANGWSVCGGQTKRCQSRMPSRTPLSDT